VSTSWEAPGDGGIGVCLITCPDPVCGAIAEILHPVVLGSTGGPIEMVRTRCLHRHMFVLPIDWSSRAAADGR
jgi:hypothetical protein